MSGYVCVDASVVAKWLLPEEHSELALQLYEDARNSKTAILAPPHMAIEVVNVIRKRESRSLITSTEADLCLQLFLRFGVEATAPAGLYEAALQLARAYQRPTVYDTHYVALANLTDCDFWTADEALVNALNGREPRVRSISGYLAGLSLRPSRGRRRS